MLQEYTLIRGARENNLKNVSLRIPKRKITSFIGVSGSGKSSIVFDTIANDGYTFRAAIMALISSSAGRISKPPARIPGCFEISSMA